MLRVSSSAGGYNTVIVMTVTVVSTVTTPYVYIACCIFSNAFTCIISFMRAPPVTYSTTLHFRRDTVNKL